MKKCICPRCKKEFEPLMRNGIKLSKFCVTCLSEKFKQQNKAIAQKEKKQALERLKTQKDKQKDLQVEINTIVRLIDAGQKCISCGCLQKGFAGHYHSVGSNNSLRFHLDNIHLQDFNCNNYKGGNIIGYNKGLIEWYGKDYQNYVEYQLPLIHKDIKLSKFDIVDKISIAREIIKELKKENRVYNASERLELRTKYNIRLEIYDISHI